MFQGESHQPAPACPAACAVWLAIHVALRDHEERVTIMDTTSEERAAIWQLILLVVDALQPDRNSCYLPQDAFDPANCTGRLGVHGAGILWAPDTLESPLPMPWCCVKLDERRAQATRYRRCRLGKLVLILFQSIAARS